MLPLKTQGENPSLCRPGSGSPRLSLACGTLSQSLPLSSCGHFLLCLYPDPLLRRTPVSMTSYLSWLLLQWLSFQHWARSQVPELSQCITGTRPRKIVTESKRTEQNGATESVLDKTNGGLNLAQTAESRLQESVCTRMGEADSRIAPESSSLQSEGRNNAQPGRGHKVEEKI